LVKGTKISTSVDYKRVEDIVVGDYVMTHKGRYRKVTTLDKHQTSRKIFKFKTIGNYEELIVTDNHPIYVAYINKKKHKNRIESLNNIEFLSADKLKYKYQFALQPKRKLNEIQHPDRYVLDDDLAYLLGWYVSDGHVNGNQIKFCLQRDQMEMAIKLKSILNRYGEQDGKVYNNRQYVFKTANIIEKDNYILVTKGSDELSKFLEYSGGVSNNKRLAEFAYNSKHGFMIAIGFLEGDGHQKNNANYDGYKREVIEVSGIYEILIKQIRQILIDNGVWSSIRHITNRKLGKDQYGLTISRKYINKIARHSLKFKEVSDINITKKNHQYETDDGFWTPIKFIEEVEYENFVYNFEVEEDHSYVASNIAVHNCMAFMMVIIYIRELHFVTVKTKKEFEAKSLFRDRLFELNDDNFIINRFK
jgi:intein/homing endonuclease